VSSPGPLPPQFPTASFPLSPPNASLAYVDVKTGQFTQVGFRFFTDIIAAIDGIGGLHPSIVILTNLSGDGTLSAAGVLTVTSTNGVPFAPSATINTTNATNITSGTLASARLPAPLNGITSIGTGLAITGGALVNDDDTVTTVALLPSPAIPRRRFVNDSTVGPVGNFGAVVVGGAGNTVPVFSDGAAWRIG
jgi:hypothetical protein